jgi:hypothetical protein
LRDYIRHQFQFSLGLQNLNGHWYAFPYPPLFYFLAAPIVRLFAMPPDAAVEITASAINSLEAFLFFGIAKVLTRSSRVALATALALPLLPLFIVRLSLAYFPATTGSALDALALLVLLISFERLKSRGPSLLLTAVLAAALLTYTQSLLNFAVLLGIFLPWDAFKEPAHRGAAATLVLCAVLAGAVAFGLFYWRYVPGILALERGEAPPEESVLLDKPQHAEAPPEPEPEDKNPFFGPDLNLWRGVRKAAYRLYVFYGLFALAIPVGLLLLLRDLASWHARFVVAWASHYLVMNVGSGGLPSPNLLRYNKEMEFVAPLFCLALACVLLWIWDRVRPLAVLYGAAWLGWSASQAAHSLGGTLPRVP